MDLLTWQVSGQSNEAEARSLFLALSSFRLPVWYHEIAHLCVCVDKKLPGFLFLCVVFNTRQVISGPIDVKVLPVLTLQTTVFQNNQISFLVTYPASLLKSKGKEIQIFQLGKYIATQFNQDTHTTCSWCYICNSNQKQHKIPSPGHLKHTGAHTHQWLLQASNQ